LNKTRRFSIFNLLSSIARIVAWLAVGMIVIWLLSVTLRTSDQISLGRIRISDPTQELNLQPFQNKIRPLRSLLQSPNLRSRQAARNYLFVDVLGNVAVFVPFGAALGAATLPSRGSRTRRRFWSWWLGVTGAGLLLSLFIEIAQLAIPSRVTDVDDIILNTLGAASGALLIWIVLPLYNTGAASGKDTKSLRLTKR
jgi:glycopeptide antibiotics resistance protein